MEEILYVLAFFIVPGTQKIWQTKGNLLIRLWCMLLVQSLCVVCLCLFFDILTYYTNVQMFLWIIFDKILVLDAKFLIMKAIPIMTWVQ